ncbi:MAG: hypothetical protein LDL44_19625, partial [Caenispirillum sp.]|nr:hypothetical protein [Caenispirillum sp.]
RRGGRYLEKPEVCVNLFFLFVFRPVEANSEVSGGGVSMQSIRPCQPVVFTTASAETEQPPLGW